MNDKIVISSEDFGALAVCALRYCQGRQTYMPSLIQGITKEHLKEVSNKDLRVMLNDCEDQARRNLYGDEKIDKPDWIKFRGALLEEKARRET